MSRDFDIIIVGAGVIGAVTASTLAVRKVAPPERIALVADRPAPAPPAPPAPPAQEDWDTRVFALSRASQRLLELCGVWQSLPAARVFAYECMHVWDATGAALGSGSLTFDCAEIGEPNLGFIVEGRALKEHALQAARAAGVVVIEAGITQAAASDAAARIRLADGRDLTANLLIGADGTESSTRERLGIDTAGHAYHQDALVAHVRTAKSHRNSAWQRFLRGGPLAFLPLPDGRSSIVWSVRRAEAARLRALDPAQFSAALTEASAEVLGAVQLASPIASFPLQLKHALEYVRPHAALVGDAAHAVHPLAGQGLNLGLLDAASLADVLYGAAGSDVGEYRLLRRYERWRKSENLLAATAFDGLDRLFSNPNPVLARLRSAGLGTVGKLTFIKRAFAQRALGLVGDVPAFLKADQAWPRK